MLAAFIFRCCLAIDQFFVDFILMSVQILSKKYINKYQYYLGITCSIELADQRKQWFGEEGKMSMFRCIP
jgi:hypothetical protein